jgi:hypothetical protein
MEAETALRVLIAEEDAETCDWTAIFLRIWGFEPLAVGSDPEALQAALADSPNSVLLHSHEAGIQVHRVKPTDLEKLISRLPSPERQKPHRRIFLDSSVYGKSPEWIASNFGAGTRE